MKTLGIIGGMGPAATADFFQKLISLTESAADQEHLPVLIDSNTHIPDRSAAILRGGEDPRPELCKSARRLEKAGAELLVITCNTAHYFYDDVQGCVSIPVLYMPRETAKAARAASYNSLALLSTSGTVKSKVYEDAFAREAPETELLIPDEKGQEALMSLIYNGVKAGKTSFDTKETCTLLEGLRSKGAQGFILGCTELPLAFSMYNIDGVTLDPTTVLAKAALKAAGAKLKF